jgi:hypothetical protein
MRDHLPEIISKQEDIEYIKVGKRIKHAHTEEVTSTWKAAPQLPAFLKNFIKPDMLIWTEVAVWNNDEHVCDFTIDSHYKIEHIHCVGQIAFETAGKNKTRIIYSGDFRISKTAKSSIFMTQLIIKGIESVAGKVIAHNFAKVGKGLQEAIGA